MNATQTNTTLGELINLFYEEYLAIYGDEEMASVAAAATINELILERATESAETEQEADAA